MKSADRILFLILFVAFPSSAVLAEAEVPSVESPSAAVPKESSPDSIFLTESLWTTMDGKQLRLAELRGKPRIIAFFYASCASACPVIVDAMKKIERTLLAHQLEMDFLLVTFDPQEDTPEALRQYANKRGLSPARWLLLQGEEDDTRELAVLLGSKYKKVGANDYAHSNLMVLLDEEGRIVARADSLADIDRFGDVVRTYLLGHHGNRG